KDDLMSFVLDTPYKISRGNNRAFYVYADINGNAKAGVSETIDIYLDENTDLIAIGTVYGYGVTVVGSAYDGDKDINNDGDVGDTGENLNGSDSSYSVIEGGDVTIANNGPAADDLAIGADDQVFLELGFKSERNIEVKQLSVTVASNGTAAADGLIDTSSTTAVANFVDLRIIDLDTQATLMGPKTFSTTNTTAGADNDISQSFAFTDSWFMDAGESRRLGITMDIENAPGISGDEITVTLAQVSTTSGIKDMDNNKFITSIIPSAMITGNPQTMRSASITLALASSPSSNTVVKNQSKVPTAGFIFTAGKGDDVTVTAITLQGYFDENSDATYGSTGADNSKNLKDTVSTAYLYDSDDNLLAKSENVSTAGTVTFTGMSWKIEKGDSQNLVVKTDILSGSVPQSGTADKYAFDVYSVTAQDSDGDNVAVTTDSPNDSSTTSTVAPVVVITVATAGTLTIQASPDQTKDNIIVAGAQNVLVGKFKTYGTTEAFIMKDVTVLLNSATSTGSVQNLYMKYPSQADPTVMSTSTKQSLTGSKAQWTNVDIYVPKDETNGIEIEVYANTNKIQSGSDAASFDDLQVIFDVESDSTTTNFKALGAASNTSITKADFSATANTALTSNKQYVYRSVPTVVTNADLIKSTSLPSGEANVYGFTVSADSGGDIALYKMAFNVGYNNLNVSGTGLGGTWDVYEVDSNGTKISSTLGTGTLSTNTVTITLTSEQTIGKGGKKHFILEAPNISVSPSTASFADITVKMIEDTSAASALAAAASQSGNFIWSDKTATSHATTTADWTNGYKVQALPTTAITLKTS
ncbi:hypothetical protein HYV56_01060, partial [Candidatus Peregrinibacteria bacterium]|nr:hypothetical protein [Candidatus Peregrinibacteria bacterium]